ncbi:MAG: hypothetical protein Q9183_002084 [Haloplaca sp. 2 TL-2023]
MLSRTSRDLLSPAAPYAALQQRPSSIGAPLLQPQSNEPHNASTSLLQRRSFSTPPKPELMKTLGNIAKERKPFLSGSLDQELRKLVIRDIDAKQKQRGESTRSDTLLEEVKKEMYDILAFDAAQLHPQLTLHQRKVLRTGIRKISF